MGRRERWLSLSLVAKTPSSVASGVCLWEFGSFQGGLVGVSGSILLLLVLMFNPAFLCCPLQKKTYSSLYDPLTRYILLTDCVTALM